MRYSQGDIVIVNFPFSDLSESKPRPAIVVSNKEINNMGQDFVLAQITTTIRNDKFSVQLTSEDLTTDIKKPSEIRINKLFTANDSIISKKISSIKMPKRIELFDKIKAVLDLD